METEFRGRRGFVLRGGTSLEGNGKSRDLQGNRGKKRQMGRETCMRGKVTSFLFCIRLCVNNQGKQLVEH